MIIIVIVYGLLVKKYSYDIYQHHRHIMRIMLAIFILPCIVKHASVITFKIKFEAIM